ncbi:hypothetical protein B0H65DRAFT_422862 [Neurospora tetraspora]|uniref:Uncharacterized protein n=1 Tax=Neurospora tetraspora TaxID=94610 RepID=A0AAE0MSY3_9PEZI|nr:hypothetical protein B0H65DRAFT_422862 [Neurospora tetraspora]
MCRINIIHFSPHHHDFHSEAPPNSLRLTTICNNCNLFNSKSSSIAFAKLNLLPRRPTEDEFMTQRQPPHQFVLCPTHVNSCCCVAYKQTTACLLQKFHSAGWQWQDVAAATAATTAAAAAAADVDGDVNGDFQSFSQARTSVLGTADEIHKQKVVMDKHLLEASELLEQLFLDLADARATIHARQPAQRRASFFREFEIPLQRAVELCQKIREADERICEDFKVFLQRRKGMSNLLMAIDKKETINSGFYPISKARQDLTELSASNIREVCEGSLRRGRELSAELVRLLDAVSNFVQPVQ